MNENITRKLAIKALNMALNYNRQRRHAALGCISPLRQKQQFTKLKVAR